jgi:hypothetical protein
MQDFSEAKILDSWRKNAALWTRAIEAQEIESRRLVTNQAIIDAVTSNEPGSVLDIGCGEGWLAAHQDSAPGQRTRTAHQDSAERTRTSIDCQRNESLVNQSQIIRYEIYKNFTTKVCFHKKTGGMTFFLATRCKIYL